MHSTKEVLDHHLQSFGRAEITEIMTGYAPDAVLFTPSGTIKGTGEIRPFFEAFFRESTKPGTTFDLKHVAVEGEYAYIVWTAETADNVYELGTDTFVVRAGKIVAQSFAIKVSPKH